MWASLLGNLKEERCEPGTTQSCTQQSPPTVRAQPRPLPLCRHGLNCICARVSGGDGWRGKAEGGAVTYAAVALLNVRQVDEEGDVVHVDTAVDRVGVETVSYTHLTLPTICSV